MASLPEDISGEDESDENGNGDGLGEGEPTGDETVGLSVGGGGPEDEGGDDGGHEHAWEQCDERADAFSLSQEPDGGGHEGGGGEDLVGPREVVPEVIEGLGALVGPPEEARDEEHEGDADDEAAGEFALWDAEHLGEGEASGAQGGIAAGDGEDDDGEDGDGAHPGAEEVLGDVSEDDGWGETQIVWLQVIESESGGSPNHGDDAFGDHHAIEGVACLAFGFHGASDDGGLCGMEAGDDAAGDGDKEEGEEWGAAVGIEDGVVELLEGGAFGEEGWIFEACDGDGNEEGERAEQEHGAEEGVDFADNFVDGEEGSGDVVEEDDGGGAPEEGGTGEELFIDEAGGDIDEDGDHEEEEANHEPGEDGRVGAAEIFLDESGQVGALVAQGHHAAEEVVYGAGEDASDGNDEEGDFAEFDAGDDADDGSHACDVEQLDEEIFPHGQGEEIDAICAGGAGGRASIWREDAFDEASIEKIPEKKKSDTAKKPEHNNEGGPMPRALRPAP